MVSVSRFYAPSYPNLVAFVSNDLPKVVQNKKVFDAFIKYAEYTRFGGQWVFYRLTDPLIQIEPLNTHSKNGDYVYAKYKTALPRYIFIDEAWAKRFEADYANLILSAKAKRLMEACILHEMCHRGDWDDGVEQVNEAGEAFEIAAYGAIQHRYW